MTVQKISADLSQLPLVFDNRPAARVETGPLEINNDWPGIFIRGDNALAYCMSLNMAIKILESNPDCTNMDIFTLHSLKNLANLLSSCRV
jgi:hypothetical protein